LMATPISVASNGHAIEPGAPVTLFATHLARGANVQAGGFQQRAQYAVSADGRFLMNVALDGAASAPISVVLNWPVALRK
jgi:hypothetical protein